jgi:hypothetical protein
MLSDKSLDPTWLVAKVEEIVNAPNSDLQWLLDSSS